MGIQRFVMEYGHGAIYYRDGQIIEAVGRGVLCTNLSAGYAGRGMAVYRLRDDVEGTLGINAAEQAATIARYQEAWYDYFGLPRFVIPHLICQKLFHTQWFFGYKPDAYYWCFELIQQAYQNAGRVLVPETVVVLDDDFSTCPELFLVSKGVCS